MNTFARVVCLAALAAASERGERVLESEHSTGLGTDDMKEKDDRH